MLFINAADQFEKGKRQNRLKESHISKIVDTYQHRKEEARYSMRVPMERIEKEGYNLNISRYISTALPEERVDLAAVNQQLAGLEKQITQAKNKHNAFLNELGLPLLP